MANLRFDIDEFDAAIRDYDAIKTSITEKKAALEKEINSAHTTYWNTEAGKKFEEISKGDWAGHIDQFIAVLDELKTLLATAKKDYQTVEDKLKQLKF